MKRVLVTGGAGYIGRYVCSRLAFAGFEPLIADPAAREPTDAIQVMQLGRLVRGRLPLGIIHLAAHSDIAESVAHPQKYVGENTAMAAAVGILANDLLGVPVVLASSAAVYGQPASEGCPITENAPLEPLNPYGISKVRSEEMLPDAMRLRFFNVAGGCGDRGRHLIPNLVRAASEGRAAEINGDVRTVRDYVHVADVARACVLALAAMLDGARGAALNVCSGQGHSIGDVGTLTAAITGEPIRVKAAPARQGDPSWLVGDNTAAKTAIGWAPRESIESMIASVWNERVLQSA